MTAASARPVWRRLVPGPRVWKTALAVGAAWLIATAVLREPSPVFAAMGAFWAMEPTILRSARRLALQLVGVAGGALLAWIGVNVLGIGALLMGFAILLGLTIGRVVGSDRIGTELSVTALLVVGLGDGSLAFGWLRLWETTLGGVVAVVVNVVVAPPDHFRRFRSEFESVARETADGLREAAQVFAIRPNHEGAAELRERARATRDRLPTVQRRLDMAGEALRFNPLRRGRLETLERYRPAVELYRRAAVHLATLGRIVADHAAADHPWPHGGLSGPAHLVACADAVARALDHEREHMRAAEETTRASVGQDLQAAEAAVRDFLATAQQERGSDTDVRRLIDIAAIAAELTHLVGDIRAHHDLEAPDHHADA